MQNHRKCHFLSVLTGRVHQPLATVRVNCAPLPDVWQSCIPSCCFFAPYCKGLWKVCEFWMDFSVQTLDIHPYYYWLLLYIYISALKQTHCAHAACHSEQVTVSFMAHYSHHSYVLTVLSGCYTAGAMWNCCSFCACLWTPHNHASIYSVISFKATYIGHMGV